MAKLIDESLAGKLNRLRLSKDISFEALAGKSGLGIATVKRMLNKGEIGEIDVLNRIFVALGLNDRLMHAINECVPDVVELPYVNSERKRASKKLKAFNKTKTVQWPEDNR